jgi:hypothetical protein
MNPGQRERSGRCPVRWCGFHSHCQAAVENALNDTLARAFTGGAIPKELERLSYPTRLALAEAVGIPIGRNLRGGLGRFGPRLGHAGPLRTLDSWP